MRETKHLPESYTSVTPVPAIRTDCPLPAVEENFVDYQLSLKDMVKEYAWFEHVKTVLAADNLQRNEITTLAAYNASQQVSKPKECDLTILFLLPLFPDMLC